jgi:flagellar motor switch/type III secretory pathway protein FliN
MRGKTQADRLEKLMQKHQRYDHYTLALPLMEVKSDKLQKLKEGDILLLGLKSLVLVLLEGDRVCADLLPLGIQGNNFEVTAMEESNERIEASPKSQVLILALDEIQRKRVNVGEIIKVENIAFDEIKILVNDKKIAEGSLVNVDGKIALQINKVEEKR